MSGPYHLRILAITNVKLQGFVVLCVPTVIGTQNVNLYGASIGCTTDLKIEFKEFLSLGDETRWRQRRVGNGHRCWDLRVCFGLLGIRFPTKIRDAWKFSKGPPPPRPNQTIWQQQNNKRHFYFPRVWIRLCDLSIRFGISIKHLSVSPLHHIMCRLRIPTSNRLMRWPYEVTLSQSSNHK